VITGSDELLVTGKENPFSLREKARMRGYKIRLLSFFLFALPNPLPKGEGVNGWQ
jgi:hypothetical protein